MQGQRERLTCRGRGQVAAIEWRVVTLGKRFAGSAETLTAIHYKSIDELGIRGLCALAPI